MMKLLRSVIFAWPEKNPILLLSLAAVLGILIADHWSWKPSWLLILITLLTWLPFARRPSLARAFPAVLISLALLHAYRMEATFDHPLRLHLLSLPARPHEATLQGTLLPWVEGSELDAATALCEVTHMRWGAGGPFLPMRARIKVQLPPGWKLDKPGRYEIQGRLSVPQPAMNPGQFDPVNYGLRSGWIAILRTRSLSFVEPEGLGLRFHLLNAAEKSRQWITTQLTRGLENEGEHAAVILAMALGASDAAGEDIEDAFRDSGTLHVFAVSGLHVVMLGQIVFWSFRGFGTRRVIFAVIVIVFVYAFITGWRPSAARAAFMSSILLMGPLISRHPRLLNSLGASALLLLIYDSHQLFTPGFQLSFGVLLAIALAATWLQARAASWYRLDPFLPTALVSFPQRVWSGTRREASSLLCVSVAAWAGSLPLMIGHFQTITPVAVVANILLVPASGLCLILSCSSLMMAALQQTWAVIGINQLNAYLAKGMVFLAGTFADLPMANHTLDLRFQGPPAPAEMRVFHLSSGGGASYIRGGEKRWLLDTGSLRAWRSVLRPFLRHEGINHLDGLILSHADIAHVGATSWVVKAQHVPHIHTSHLEPWAYDPPFASLKKLSSEYRPNSTVWRRHQIEDVLSLAPNPPLPITAQVLYPGTQDRYEKADDRGLVLMLHIGPWKVLYLNDAGFITEKTLLSRRTPLQCDILIRHQHRADYSGLPELIHAAAPQVVISSNNTFPMEERLPERLRHYCEHHQIPLLDLEVTGSIGMEFQTDAVQITSFQGGASWRLKPASAEGTTPN
ncbi:ComEC/Rec2-related protein [Prosthecobacter debontii]|uniref:ComEC/Rec2-related protein n=1 Tax=Prosthecobacter debontii TaxID=48467 RepID=A0A1T4WJK5_9BACT|nr:ComEC/Rec2 family competence protein [Prosthecobacter debontii]SKA77536.1 ComEC/Rec2-related protein [Prosthecobacter debontii]